VSDQASDVADIGEILRLLPHRYPFLLIDRVVDIRGDEHGIGIKNLTINEPFFAAGNLVIPGVLVIEGMAQTAGVLALRALPPTDRRRIPFFLSIDKAKFRKPAGPGDRLEYHVDKLANRRNVWRYRGEAKVGRILVAERQSLRRSIHELLSVPNVINIGFSFAALPSTLGDENSAHRTWVAERRDPATCTSQISRKSKCQTTRR
jgi:3-hydroxyacyl-[acyl-carrier-protein] dehydratase